MFWVKKSTDQPVFVIPENKTRAPAAVKPHIFRRNGEWFCQGGPGWRFRIACSPSPAMAYETWNARDPIHG